MALKLSLFVVSGVSECLYDDEDTPDDHSLERLDRLEQGVYLFKALGLIGMFVGLMLACTGYILWGLAMGTRYSGEPIVPVGEIVAWIPFGIGVAVALSTSVELMHRWGILSRLRRRLGWRRRLRRRGRSLSFEDDEEGLVMVVIDGDQSSAASSGFDETRDLVNMGPGDKSMDTTTGGIPMKQLTEKDFKE